MLQAFQHYSRDVLMSVAKDEMLVLFISNEEYSITSCIPLRLED